MEVDVTARARRRHAPIPDGADLGCHLHGGMAAIAGDARVLTPQGERRETRVGVRKQGFGEGGRAVARRAVRRAGAIELPLVLVGVAAGARDRQSLVADGGGCVRLEAFRPVAGPAGDRHVCALPGKTPLPAVLEFQGVKGIGPVTRAAIVSLAALKELTGVRIGVTAGAVIGTFAR